MNNDKRFTNSDGTIRYWWDKRNEPQEMHKQELANIKLAQLEDIEEELGIDLITLFKAFQNTIYVKWDNEKIPHKDKVEEIYFADFDEMCFMLSKTREAISVRDYGKHWALTKEELE